MIQTANAGVDRKRATGLRRRVARNVRKRALRRLLSYEYGFSDLGLNRIAAKHMARNPASGRVMQRAGMLLEGTARQGTMKWGNYEDLVLYGILRNTWPP